MQEIVLLGKQKADFIRKNVVEVAVNNGAGHIAPSLSCVDILTSLYYNVMNVNTFYNTSKWVDRDRFILSKAHGCYGLYSILADLDIIPKKEWLNFYNGSSLTGCAEKNDNFAIEAGCGSLGHGLPMAVGIAFGAKIQNKQYHTYCLVGDGEMQEGTMWEALQFAEKHQLLNFTLIVDANNLQAMDYVDNILTPKGDLDSLSRKISAFGFEVKACNGHNVDEITAILLDWKNENSINKPKCLIARTIKGYGLKCMENIAKFHFRLPTEEELQQGNRYE